MRVDAAVAVRQRDPWWTITGMRNTHSCPKCQSVDILRIPGNVGAYGVGNNIATGGTIFRNTVLVTRYLCAYCGFSEEWVEDRADVEKLRAKYHE